MKCPTRSTLLVLVALAAPPAALAQAGAHVHGLVRLDVVIEPGRLSLLLDAPQEALLGHERAPRSAAEKQAAAALLARLRGAALPWMLEPALKCVLQRSEVHAPLLEAAAPVAADHAEVSAAYDYACAGAPGRIDLGALLDAYKGITRIEARIVGPEGQRKAELKRPARVLVWGR